MTNANTGRARDLNRYAPRLQFTHASLEEFLDSPVPLDEGIHSIAIGSATADFLYEERGGPLLVVFPAALGKTVTWPFFTGLGIAHDVSASLLALSDPSVELPGVGTGWSLGDHRVSFHTILPAIIRKFAPSRRLIFFGMSAGVIPLYTMFQSLKTLSLWSGTRALTCSLPRRPFSIELPRCMGLRIREKFRQWFPLELGQRAIELSISRTPEISCISVAT